MIDDDRYDEYIADLAAEKELERNLESIAANFGEYSEFFFENANLVEEFSISYYKYLLREHFLNENSYEISAKFLSDSIKLFHYNEFNSALLNSFISLEILLKNIIVQPVIKNLLLLENLNTEELSNLFINSNSLDKIKKIITDIILQLTNIDLTKEKREDSKITVLNELDLVRVSRNKLIHEGKSCDKFLSLLSINLTKYFHHSIFLILLRNLSLEIDENGSICHFRTKKYTSDILTEKTKIFLDTLNKLKKH